MRTFRLKVIADRIEWGSLPQILEDVRKFYAPSVDLNISIVHTSLSPVYNSTYADLAPLAVVDYDWYDRNVTVPHLADADIVLLLTPQPTTPTTYAGIMTFANCGPWECTVFVTKETDRASVNGKDLGNSTALVIKHELAHAFYRMKNPAESADHTHQYFYGGTPEKVLPDLVFNTPTVSESIADMIRILTGASVALGLITKKRQTIEEAHEQPKGPDLGNTLYATAFAALGRDVAKTQDELGCAEAVSFLVNKAYGDFPAGVLSTYDLFSKLSTHGKFTLIAGVPPKPGDVLVSPTSKGSTGLIPHGHTGIVAPGDRIYSNDSASGLFKDNYSLASWRDRYVTKGGYPMYFFRRIA